MHVLGTAGHVDHGKSTLVQALTGISPDRLEEEIRREMTIDLGFAWMSLPDGETIGVVDVPGHQDFIENMLAGVGGIDAVLLIVAADEGIMPQTREHLAIINLLHIPGGVVALTKIDLISDEDWLNLVEEEIRQSLNGTVLETAPIVRVSARTGQGIAELKKAIQTELIQRDSAIPTGQARLPVDRAFTLTGFGTIVTGTLLGGPLQSGEEVEILPDGIRSRVRGLQSYKQKVEIAFPGSRVAINLAGTGLDQVSRGMVISKPGAFRPTRRIDAQVDWLPEASISLEHHAGLKFFLGTRMAQTHVRLLGRERLLPGESGWVQLEFEEEIIAEKGDRFILRLPSPGETLGGGMVIDAHPEGRYKRFSPDVLQRLESRISGTPVEVLLTFLERNRILSFSDLQSQMRMDEETLTTLLEELIARDAVHPLPSAFPLREGLFLPSAEWSRLTHRVVSLLSEFHTRHPLRLAMPREELKNRLQAPGKAFPLIIAEWEANGILISEGTGYRLPDFSPTYTADQRRRVQALLEEFSAHPTNPPSVKACIEKVGAEVYGSLIETGILRQISPEVVYTEEAYQQILLSVRQYLQRQKSITVVQFRDLFSTSRKCSLAFLEFLDANGITVRNGDYRTLKGQEIS